MIENWGSDGYLGYEGVRVLSMDWRKGSHYVGFRVRLRMKDREDMETA